MKIPTARASCAGVLLAFVVLTALAAPTTVTAGERLAVQLKWVVQAQFAGYFVAQDLGYYDAAGLDVILKPGGPGINLVDVAQQGGADVIVGWLPEVLAAREKGIKLVNIAQVFSRSGLMLTCRRDAGIATPADFRGKTLGVWFHGNEYPFLQWMARLGYKASAPGADIKVMPQGFDVEPLISGVAACISTMTYNEYWQVLNAGLAPDALALFKYEDQGVATLEDGLYTLEGNLADPNMADRLTRFVGATIKGWKRAIAKQKEAVEIVLDNDVTGAQTVDHQTFMMREVGELVGADVAEIGYLDPAAFERTVDVLLSADSTPVIRRRPVGAWTHAIWDRLAAQ